MSSIASSVISLILCLNFVNASYGKSVCTDEQLTKIMNITNICNFIKAVTDNKNSLLKLMKFSKQNPTMYSDVEDYDSIFFNANATLKMNGFFYSKDLKRPNGFAALCNHDVDVEKMTFENCNLLRRSFTNKGIGFSYNNAKAADLYKSK